MMDRYKEALRQLLLRLQQYTKTDMIYLARGGFWSTAPFIFSSVLSIALVWAFANLLPKDIYGTYKFVMSLSGSLSFLTLTGINIAVTQAAARGYEGVLPYALKIQLRWNVLFTIAMFGVAGYYFIHNNALIGTAVCILAVTFPLTTSFNTYGAYLFGKKQFRQIAGYQIFTSFFYIAAMVSILAVTDNLLFIITVYALGSLTPLLFFYYRTLQLSGEQSQFLAEQKAQFLNYLKHLSVMNIFSTLSQYVDKIVVFHYLGAVELAVYGIALAIPERIRGYFKTLTALVMPKVSGKEIIDLRKTFYMRLSQAFLLGLLISISYIIATPHIFKLLLPAYPESVRYSQVIALVFIFLLPGTYIAEIFRAHAMIRALYLSSVIAHISRIILFIAFGIMWGVWGVIIASLTVTFVGLFWNILLWEIESRRRIATF
ncbi:MAG: hypothetical protein AAB479_00815 [Patescibacteria group bacterium]